MPATYCPDSQGYPTLQLTHGETSLSLYLPDVQNGWYRAARFDWSSMMQQATWRGHTFFGPFRNPHIPTSDECSRGPSEEYSMGIDGHFVPMGWQNALDGGTFLKIGVGTLGWAPSWPGRADDQYFFRVNYPIVDSGSWSWQADDSGVAITHRVSHPMGWAYRLDKYIGIDADGQGFYVRRTLANVGSQPILANHYSHNYFIIDSQPMDPDYELAVPFDLPPQHKYQGPLQVQGRKIVFAQPAIQQATWMGLLSAGVNDDLLASADNNRVTVRNRHAGAEVTVSCDRPMEKLCLYAESVALCPEAFVILDVPAGEQTAWTTRYRFDALAASGSEW